MIGSERCRDRESEGEKKEGATKHGRTKKKNMKLLWKKFASNNLTYLFALYFPTGTKMKKKRGDEEINLIQWDCFLMTQVIRKVPESTFCMHKV